MKIRHELNDAQIKFEIECRGISEVWKESCDEAYKNGNCPVLIYQDLDSGELIVIREFKGVPGDEGLLMAVIPRSLIGSPEHLRTLAAYKLDEISGTGWVRRHVPNPLRN